MGKRVRDESITAEVKAIVALSSINDKFHFLSKAKSVLDLCAAMGGWMELAAGRIQKGGLVFGVDLRPISGEINTCECQDTIIKYMAEKGVSGFDVVMRGGLSPDPNATAWEQAYLLVESIKFATKFLAPGGTFVTKMFSGARDYNPMLHSLKQLFCKVDVRKSTLTSAETYIVALSYKAPEKIHRDLLVPRYLFSIKEEGEVALASDFVWSESPLDVLGSARSLTFDAVVCLSLKDHCLTTKRIKRICKDLRVMEKRHFKHLMKWRSHVREALSHPQKVKAAGAKNEYECNNDASQMHAQQAAPAPQAIGPTTMGLFQELVRGQQRLERKVDCIQELLQFYVSQTPELVPGMAEIFSRWADPEASDDSKALAHAQKAKAADAKDENKRNDDDDWIPNEMENSVNLDKQKRKKKRKKTV